uniref:PDZ domain-containing protein n=1 Tax=Cyprinus carpio TaxID=7962 RepID=A0A8C2FGV6_CYPCA
MIIYFLCQSKLPKLGIPKGDVTRVMPSQTLRPRLCVLEKGENGYGFHMHGEKGKSGQFIRLVEPDSPAEVSGLRAGDRLVFVNGERVESDICLTEKIWYL